MKKLLVLALVCGMASLASAFYVNAPATVNAGETFSIIIGGVDNEVLSGGVYGDIDAFAGSIVGNAGNLAFVNHIASWGGWDFNVEGTTLGTDQRAKAGDWIKLDYVAGAAGTVHSFAMYDYGQSDSVAAQTVAVTVVPEPATMVLLGLGALVLRRKK